MKVLLIIDEMWSDIIHPNNPLTNWFTEFEDVEFATICCSPGIPQTNCCDLFYQITDIEMIKSLFTKYRAGKIIKIDSSNIESTNFYGTKKNWFSNELFRIIRSIIWRFGKYNIKSLKAFIFYFKPDIIFSIRRGSIKISRLEIIVRSLVNVPIVAFTGDDEYSNRQFCLNPLWWAHHFWTRKWLRKAYNNYSLFYTSSYKQAEYFDNKFGVKTKFLVKVGDFKNSNLHSLDSYPIKMLYAGKLYCQRYKTLLTLSDIIEVLNNKFAKQCYQLNIFSPDGNESKYVKKFNKYKSTFLNGRITPEQLKKVSNNSDILLHVEGLDLKNSLLTKYSFSTKLIDCLSSGSSTLVISKPYHSGYEYCRSNNIAFTASNKEELMTIMKNILDDTNILKNMALNAINYGNENLERKRVQGKLLNDFNQIILNYLGGK